MRTLEEIARDLRTAACRHDNAAQWAAECPMCIRNFLAEAREGARLMAQHLDRALAAEAEVKRLREEFERNGLHECPTCGAFGKHGKPCGGECICGNRIFHAADCPKREGDDHE